MSKAGPLTRSVSKRLRSAAEASTETPAGNNNNNNNNSHTNAVQAPSNAPSPRPSGGFGRRLHSDEIVIGLALGSPAHPPDDRNVDVSYVCNSPENHASTLGNVYEIGSLSKGVRQKGRKWKSLGSFFGRREVQSTSPFYHLDQSPQPEPAIAQDYLETGALRHKRADSSHGKKAHQKVMSVGVPGEESIGLLWRSSSRRRGLRRRKVDEPQPEMQRIPARHTAHAIAKDLDPRGEQQGSRVPGPSLLQVEIPCVELERYSVMFGDVLEPQLRKSKPPPSLLARRQGHLEELNTVADSNSKAFDLNLPNPGLQADSISSKASRSPSFSLFPSTPPLPARNPVTTLLPKPSPLSRSVTAPNHDPLQARPAIKNSNSQDQDRLLVIIHNSDDTGILTSHGGLPGSDPSPRSANSTSASFFKSAEYPEHTIQDDPPTPTNSAAQDFLQRAFPARKSSMKKLAPSEARYRRGDLIGPAAEVSVARQISISRQQRQLLVPIVPKTARQPMQPKINEQSTTEESRKSYHLTLEHA